MIKTILIVGCGSIGQRHARNAKQIGIENIILCDINVERLEKFSKEINTNLLYQDYKKALKEHPEIEAVIISTPSGLHIEPAMFFAEHKISIFIEKPLSDNLNGVNELVEIVRKNNVVAMMGQSYRFHEGFLQLKKLLGEIGKIYHVNYFGGQYLPDWHPEMDYRNEYASQKRLSGGVLLTSMSHSFDIIQWLFGDIINITGWKAKLSNLEIDVEDCVFCLIKTQKNIIIQSGSDFLQRENRHQMIIIGEKGHIEADFIKHKINIWTVNNPVTKTIDYDFDPNRRYIDELKYFVTLIEEREKEHNLDLCVGKKVLELIKNSNIILITEE